MIEKFINYINHDSMYGFVLGIAALSFVNAVIAERKARVEDHWRAYADAQTAVLWYISALLLILVTK